MKQNNDWDVPNFDKFAHFFGGRKTTSDAEIAKELETLTNKIIPKQMKKLTFHQTEFLLTYFFKNNEYAGWRGIACKLLEKGKCTVAGTNCIWLGGIGNFIKTSPAEDAIDCLLYEFNLTEFLQSAWYLQIYNAYMDELQCKLEALIKENNEIRDL